VAVLAPDAVLEELGVDSVLAMRLVDELEPFTGPLDLAALLPHLTTVGELTAYLEQQRPAAPARQGDAR
jgi:acyl carrier protein